MADTKQLYGNLEIDKEVDNEIAVALFQFERYATNRNIFVAFVLKHL